MDILGEVATGWRYEDLGPRAQVVQIGAGVEVQILGLEALREKDRAVLPLYRRVLRERGGDRVGVGRLHRPWSGWSRK